MGGLLAGWQRQNREITKPFTQYGNEVGKMNGFAQSPDEQTAGEGYRNFALFPSFFGNIREGNRPVVQVS